MEVVVALGVIAFTVPIILSATGAATSSKSSAEADTRSAWLAKEAQRQIIASWDDGENSAISTDLDFPDFGSKAAPNILLYDIEGEFIAEGDSSDLTASSATDGAAYIVTFYGESHTPPNLTGSSDTLSYLHVKILHPAKAVPDLRKVYSYNILSPKGGVL